MEPCFLRGVVETAHLDSDRTVVCLLATVLHSRTKVPDGVQLAAELIKQARIPPGLPFKATVARRRGLRQAFIWPCGRRFHTRGDDVLLQCVCFTPTWLEHCTHGLSFPTERTPLIMSESGDVATQHYCTGFFGL